MAKHKLRQYAELNTFSNVVQPVYDQIRDGHSLRGKWAKDHFENGRPIVLELGCGKGEYTVNLVSKDSSRNYIGLDRKGARIWRGGKDALEGNISNVAFIRVDIQVLPLLFDEAEVEEIWITFPDPQPKKHQVKKRLTNPSFLEMYRKVLKPNGVIHLKTDNLPFHEYTLEVIQEMGCLILEQTKDLYKEGGSDEATAVQTFYEKKFLGEGMPITYLRFQM